MGLQARLMSQALRKITAVASRSKTCVIFINQIRMKIGVMFGNPETTPGGLALKFHASVRMDIRRIETIKQGEVNIGNRVRVKVLKNKMASPFRNAEFEIIFGQGISYTGDLLDLAVEQNVIEKTGAWFSLGGERLGQGRENVREMLKANPDLLAQVEKQVKAKLGMEGQEPKAEKAEPEPEKEEGRKRGRPKGS
jgi:recombination protein RecA